MENIEIIFVWRYVCKLGKLMWIVWDALSNNGTNEPCTDKNIANERMEKKNPTPWRKQFRSKKCFNLQGLEFEFKVCSPNCRPYIHTVIVFHSFMGIFPTQPKRFFLRLTWKLISELWCKSSAKTNLQTKWNVTTRSKHKFVKITVGRPFQFYNTMGKYARKKVWPEAIWKRNSWLMGTCNQPINHPPIHQFRIFYVWHHNSHQISHSLHPSPTH